jgi:hypothetical protein
MSASSRNRSRNEVWIVTNAIRPSASVWVSRRALEIVTTRPRRLRAAVVERLTAQLSGLVDLGNTVIVVEHDMHVVAGSDWVIDIGPGAGDAGGRVVAAGAPSELAQGDASRTAPFLNRVMSGRAAAG